MLCKYFSCEIVGIHLWSCQYCAHTLHSFAHALYQKKNVKLHKYNEEGIFCIYKYFLHIFSFETHLKQFQKHHIYVNLIFAPLMTSPFSHINFQRRILEKIWTSSFKLQTFFSIKLNEMSFKHSVLKIRMYIKPCMKFSKERNYFTLS